MYTWDRRCACSRKWKSSPVRHQFSPERAGVLTWRFACNVCLVQFVFAPYQDQIPTPLWRRLTCWFPRLLNGVLSFSWFLIVQTQSCVWSGIALSRDTQWAEFISSATRNLRNLEADELKFIQERCVFEGYSGKLCCHKCGSSKGDRQQNQNQQVKCCGKTRVD